jgi:NADH dehydrogenase FAD-containing subunit
MMLRRPVFIICIAASVAMTGGIIASVVMSGDATPARDKDSARVLPPAAATAPPPGSPVAALLLERFSATRERPLFSPTRRPPPPPPAPVVGAPPPPPAPPKVTLLGTVMDAGEARALVNLESANKMLRLRIGDDIEGWKVTHIETRRLVLSREDRLATFTLFGGQGAGPAQGQPLSALVQRRRE